MVCCAVLIFLLLAQSDTLSLTGTVFDAGAKPAGEVRVRLEQLTEQRKLQTTTQPDGTFRFERLSYGTYRLTIQKEGYFDISTEVRLESSQLVEFTLAAAEKVTQDIEVVARPEPINPDRVSPQVTVNNEIVQNIIYA